MSPEERRRDLMLRGSAAARDVARMLSTFNCTADFIALNSGPGIPFGTTWTSVVAAFQADRLARAFLVLSASLAAGHPYTSSEGTAYAAASSNGTEYRTQHF